jgi:membrane protein DedA with SNARE-associated domain
MEESLVLVQNYGVVLVLAIVFLEQVGMPIPALPVLLIAGAVSAGGTLNVLTVFAAAIFACLAGDLIWYGAGRWRGHRILQLLCRISISPDSCVRQTENFFGRWGVGTLVIAKFVPGLSTIAPTLAGAMNLRLSTFLLFNGIGSAVWAGSGILAGYLLHAQIESMLVWLARMGWYAGLALGMIVLAWICWRLWERHRFLAALRGARISVEELYRMMDEGHDPVVLDVRTPSARLADARIIPGARFVDLSAPDEHLTGVPVHREIIVYCS